MKLLGTVLLEAVHPYLRKPEGSGDTDSTHCIFATYARILTSDFSKNSNKFSSSIQNVPLPYILLKMRI